MPIVYETELKRDISSLDFSPVYILYGDDTYLKKHYADVISEKAYDGDPFFNLQRFEGDIVLQDVYDAVNQYPMMADSKCVTVDDIDFEKLDKSDFEKLCTILSDVPKGCVLLLRFDSVEIDEKHSQKFKSIVSAAEKCGGKAVCLNHRRPAELVKMLSSGAKKRNCTLPETVAKYMVETVGEDINILKNELEKLCFFVGENGVVEKDTVDLVCVKSVEASIYDFSKQIFACNITNALNLLDDMFYKRFEPIIIMSTVTSSFVDAYRVFSAQKSGTPISVVAEVFAYGKKRFLLDTASRNARKLDDNKFKLCFEALLNADKSLKSFGSDPRLVLEELTVRLVYIIAKGE